MSRFILLDNKLYPVVLKLECASEPLGRLVITHIAEPMATVYYLLGLGWGLRIDILRTTVQLSVVKASSQT